MAINRTNGGPGCSSLEGFLQENGVNNTLTLFSSALYLSLSLSPGVMDKRGLLGINLAGPIFPVCYGSSNQ